MHKHTTHMPDASGDQKNDQKWVELYSYRQLQATL